MALESHEADPTVTDPDLYRTVFENERVRVLVYTDHPGVRTNPHHHPDSVMVTVSGFRRRVSSGDRSVDVELGPGQIPWLAAQEHVGENTGDTDTHIFLVELKEPNPAADEAADGAAGGTGRPSPLGP